MTKKINKDKKTSYPIPLQITKWEHDFFSLFPFLGCKYLVRCCLKYPDIQMGKYLNSLDFTQTLGKVWFSLVRQ